ncbi:alpha-amylase family glycosyl hydrolase [[Mycoplasma] imitans]|uniref:alpha-amylase family glycosyl hydrolase n=1 Tax=[Mycoplasma] imitans TaxID=29560 RepID=UPI0006878AA5|nr:alpha-amylase family glycosyl hydrolase [[Mycoplasma] imitans]
MKKFKDYEEEEYQKYLKSQPKDVMGDWNDPRYENKTTYVSYKGLYENVKKAQPLKDYKNTKVIYQLLVYSFCDGNNDGIGDFIGLKNKLDYIDQLGVDQILLSPINPSSSYHGYDVINYCAVADQLGGMDAFVDFLSAAHQRGIKVYLDLVFNHTSYEHPWFQKALENKEKYKDFYRFVDRKIDDDVKQDDQAFVDFYNLDKQPTNQYYLARFSQQMPDLNLDNEDVIQQLEYIQMFWTAIGVDGFRYDAISEYFSSEIETKNHFNERKIFTRLRKASFDVNNQNIFMMGEWISSDPLKALMYCGKYSGGKNNDFYPDYPLDTIYDGHKHWTNQVDTDIGYHDLIYLTKQYAQINAPWVCLLNNHDTRRWLDVYREEVLNLKDQDIFKPSTATEDEAIKVALFNMLSMPAMSIIYAGDELGYYGTRIFGDPGLREPMKWINPKDNCFFVDKRMAIHGNKPHILLTQSNSLEPIEERINKEDSIYKMIQKMCQLRKENPELTQTDPKTVADPYHVVDTDDYSGIISRGSSSITMGWRAKDDNYVSNHFLFVYSNYKHKKRTLLKISRNYHFKPLLLHKVKNNAWNIEIEENGYAVYELISKSSDTIPFIKRPRPK